MDFITISQYFNRMQSALFILLIVPLLVFATVYVLVSGMPPDPRMEYYVIISAAVSLDWIMATLIFNKKIKSVRNEQGLGVKLDKYFRLTIVRYTMLSSANLLLALGLYLSRMDVFTALYVAGLVLAGLLWPTSRRVSGDLKLRGDEREMVYFKKDTL